jgi:hypothetical protein
LTVVFLEIAKWVNRWQSVFGSCKNMLVPKIIAGHARRKKTFLKSSDTQCTVGGLQYFEPASRATFILPENLWLAAVVST